MKLRGRFCDQRIAGKELKRLLHAGKVAGAVLGHIAFSVRVVVANAAEMTKQLARGDGPFLLRKRRAIFLHRRVQVQFAALPKLKNGGRSNRLGDRTEAEERRGSGGRGILQIGHPKSLGPAGLAFEDNCRRKARNAISGHEAGDGFFDFLAFFRRKPFLLC